jgi:hypothetical protein
VVIVNCAASAAGSGFGAGEGIALPVILMEAV